jgi:lipooligosaccharide transport system permease protein
VTALAATAGSLSRAGAVTAWHARTYKRVWRATITTAFLNPIFFLLSIGVLLGSLVDDGQADLGGLTYLEFVAPGLLAVTAMQLGTNDSTYPVMAGIKWWRTFHAVVATPVRGSELVFGGLAWSALRMLVALVIFASIAALGGAFVSPLAVIAPPAALLCGLAFAAPIAAFSARLEDDFWIPTLMRFGIIPMFLFAGTFFPVEQLPDWLEPVAWATPLWHGVELTRDVATGEVDIALDLVHVAFLVAFTAVGAVFAVRACKGKLGK